MGSMWSNKAKDSKKTSETTFPNQVTNLNLQSKKNVNCPLDEKYRASVDYEFNTPEECEKAKRELDAAYAEMRKPLPRRDLDREAFERRQLISASETKFLENLKKPESARMEYLYPLQAGKTIMINGKETLIDERGRPVPVVGGKSRKARKIRKSRKTKRRMKSRRKHK